MHEDIYELEPTAKFKTSRARNLKFIASINDSDKLPGRTRGCGLDTFPVFNIIKFGSVCMSPFSRTKATARKTLEKGTMRAGILIKGTSPAEIFTLPWDGGGEGCTEYGVALVPFTPNPL